MNVNFESETHKNSLFLSIDLFNIYQMTLNCSCNSYTIGNKSMKFLPELEAYHLSTESSAASFIEAGPSSW